MTDQEIKEIRERCDKATPGPWECHDLGPTLVEMPKSKPAQVYKWVDADFIAHARKDIPKLLGEVVRLKEALKKIAKHEYSDSSYSTDCEEADAFRECVAIAREALRDER
jgi:hypothetical protein